MKKAKCEVIIDASKQVHLSNKGEIIASSDKSLGKPLLSNVYIDRFLSGEDKRNYVYVVLNPDNTVLTHWSWTAKEGKKYFVSIIAQKETFKRDEVIKLMRKAWTSSDTSRLEFDQWLKKLDF